MWNRLLNKLRKDKFDNMGDLIAQIKSVRKYSDIIVFCPSTTGSSWKGVNIASKNLFKSMVVELPQYYSHSLLSAAQMKELTDVLMISQFSQIIFSGFLPYMKEIITNSGKTQIGVVFHGALSELIDNTVSREGFKQIEILANQKQIHKVGFIKKGLSETFSQLWELPCYELLLGSPIDKRQIETLSGINIGVFGVHNFNKNIINQVYAALLIPESKVHVLGYSDVFEKMEEDRIIVHPTPLPREEFLALLGAMSVNLHLSFSESWGQIVTESLASGVPCLSSYNNGIFDFDEFLANRLLVSQYDNPMSIAQQIKEVLNEKEEVSRKGKEYIIKLNTEAEEKLQKFLND